MNTIRRMENDPRILNELLVAVFGMLLGDTLILDTLDAANEYRKMVGMVLRSF